MKKAAIFLSIFFVTLTIGYFAVPNLLKGSKIPQVLAPVEKEFPITQIVQTQMIDRNDETKFETPSQPIEYDWEHPRKFKTKLLETGDFHSEDLTGKSGETWFGLFQQGKISILIPTKIKIKKITEPELFDKEVSTTNKGKSIFLIKNAKILRQGEIQTVFLQNEEEFDETASLKNGSDKNFEFNGEIYNLRVENSLSKDEFPSRGSKLILSFNGKEQILTYLKENCDDCGWSIYWIGDLDRDGKLDFYLDLSEHYNVIDKVLFLSSKAEKNKLVKAVANLGTVGC
jgi:hypothetical protein